MTAEPETPSWQRWVDVVLFVAGWGVSWAALDGGIWGDGEGRARFLKQLVTQHTLSSERYSGIGPLFAAPLLWLDASGASLWRYNLLLLALAAPALWVVLRRVTTPAIARATVLLLLCGSMLTFHLMTFYGEVFTALGLALGLGLVLTGQPKLGWVLCVLGAANTPATLPALGLAAAFIAVREKKLQPFAAVALSAALVLFEAWLRRGDPLNQGYENDGAASLSLLSKGEPGFSTPFVYGFLGLTVSFGRGLLFYVPGLWLVFFARRVAGQAQALLTTWSLVLIGLVVTYSKWWAWHGATYHGPRFLLFAVFPASLMLALLLRTRPLELGVGPRVLTVFALAFSVWNGVIAGVENYFRTVERTGLCGQVEGGLCLYTPQYSPVFAPVWNWMTLKPIESAFVAWAVLAGVWLGAAFIVTTGRNVMAALKHAAAQVLPLSNWRW